MNLSQAESREREIDEYIDAHSDVEPAYLANVFRETNLYTTNPRMMSGHLQGRFLKMMVQLIGAKRVIELGTFSGYSALAMAEGMDEDGKVVTIEINDEMEDFIRKQLSSVEHGKKVELLIGNATELIPSMQEQFDMAFIDADKRLYQEYIDLLLPKMRKGGLILADNTLWDGKVLIENPPKSDRQTLSIKAFNDNLVNDGRVDVLILPMRDGLTMIRKR